MSEHYLFHLVFLGQIFLVSFYYPRRILNRMRYVFRTYPPSTHPKLYPKPIEHYEKRQRHYRIINLVILALGLSILAVLLVYPRSGEWDHAIATWYFLVQISPVLLLDLSSRRDFQLMRYVNPRTTRKAALHRRRLLDFVSPAFLSAAAATYVAFIAFVVYIRRFEFPWFGGYWNIVGVTLMNLCFAAIILRYMHGKKLNPHQAYEDRLRQIETIAKILVFTSIAATVCIAIIVTLSALDLRSFQPVAQSLYLQLVAVISLQAYRIDSTDFDVYREDELVTLGSGKP